MELCDRQRQALGEMRLLLGKFVTGYVQVSEFLPAYRSLFASFDPPDLSTSGLSTEERAELDLFIRFMGGWFGEDEESIPQRADWQYGSDTEPYAWVDGPAYRQWIRAEVTAAGRTLPGVPGSPAKP